MLKDVDTSYKICGHRLHENSLKKTKIKQQQFLFRRKKFEITIMLKGRFMHGPFHAVQNMRMLRRKPEIGKFAPDAIDQFAKCVKAAALTLSYIVQNFY